MITIFKILSLSNFKIDNTVLLTTIAMLYLTSPVRIQFSREMRGWEIFPGVASGCKSTHFLYLRCCVGCWCHKDNSDRDPAPSKTVGGEEGKKQVYTVGDRCPKQLQTHARQGGMSLQD